MNTLSGPKDWSPLDEKRQIEMDDLVAAFEGKRYRGWKFNYMYPGYFSFLHPKSEFMVFFTPDFNRQDEIDIQVHKQDGTPGEGGADIPFTVRTPENLFDAVRPWLDKYHPGKHP